MYYIIAGSIPTLLSAKASQLLPSQDALKQHILRANYQTVVWGRALIVQPHIPSPHNHGWIQTNDCLRLHWMDKLPALRDLLEMVSCNCKTGYASQGCSCRSNNLVCTDVCGCTENNICNRPEDGTHDTDENENSCGSDEDSS